MSAHQVLLRMRIRQHLSQHEAVEDLPLVTESAVVTGISAMDRKRNDEVVTELRVTLDEHGMDAWRRDRPTTDEACEDWIGDQLDMVDYLEGGTPVTQYVLEDNQIDYLGEKLAALQERYLQPYPSLLRITVETDDPVEFAAGQYLSVRYQDTTRVYSIASSPTRDEIEFCARRVPGGQMTSELAVDLEAGDTLTLRGPYGELLLEEPRHEISSFSRPGRASSIQKYDRLPLRNRTRQVGGYHAGYLAQSRSRMGGYPAVP